MSEKTIVTHIENRDIFMDLLTKNPGLIIIKFGANWCKACTQVKNVVHGFFVHSPKEVMCCDINIDECRDVYSFLRSKKMINGIPTMMCYKKGNTSFIPDDSVVGSQPQQLDQFFRRCSEHLRFVLRNNA
jgi:thioredoxin-like negative regulator of GroEL